METTSLDSLTAYASQEVLQHISAIVIQRFKFQGFNNAILSQTPRPNLSHQREKKNIISSFPV